MSGLNSSLTAPLTLPLQDYVQVFTSREPPPRPQERTLAAQRPRDLPAASGGLQRPLGAFLGLLAGRAKAHPTRRPLPTPPRLPKWRSLPQKPDLGSSIASPAGEAQAGARDDGTTRCQAGHPRQTRAPRSPREEGPRGVGGGKREVERGWRRTKTPYTPTRAISRSLPMPPPFSPRRRLVPCGAGLLLLLADAAVPEFVRRRAQDDPSEEEITVPTAAGAMQLTLAWVPEERA